MSTKIDLLSRTRLDIVKPRWQIALSKTIRWRRLAFMHFLRLVIIDNSVSSNKNRVFRGPYKGLFLCKNFQLNKQHISKKVDRWYLFIYLFVHCLWDLQMFQHFWDTQCIYVNLYWGLSLLGRPNNSKIRDLKQFHARIKTFIV